MSQANDAEARAVVDVEDQTRLITSEASDGVQREFTASAAVPQSRAYGLSSYLRFFGSRRGSSSRPTGADEPQQSSPSTAATEDSASEPVASTRNSEANDERSLEQITSAPPQIIPEQPPPTVDTEPRRPASQPATPNRQHSGWLSRRVLFASPASRSESVGAESTPATPLLSDAEHAESDSEIQEHAISIDSSVNGPSVAASPFSQHSRSLSVGNSSLLSCFPPTIVTDYVQKLCSSSSCVSLSAQSSIGKHQACCLICLDPLTQEDFENGSAIQLACKCKGEAAMRHVSCARQWIKVKRDRICDVCKTEITNLPAPTPTQSELDEEEGRHRHVPEWDVEEEPQPASAAEFMYTILKISWLVMVFCVLFLDLPMGRSTEIGIIAAVSYAVISKMCIALVRWIARMHTTVHTDYA